MAERSEEREIVNNERPQERESISVEKIRKKCRKISNSGETLSKDGRR